MEVFDGADFVRLRSVVRRSKYLVADVDGRSVCLSGQRGTHNAVWAVEHAPGPYGPSVVLRGAYGFYLCATIILGDDDDVVIATQNIPPTEAPPHEMVWRAYRRRGTFVLRSGLGLNRYLRANGRYRWWNREVTVVEDDNSTMMQWAIEIVPRRMAPPHILDVAYQSQLTHRYRPAVTAPAVTRFIWSDFCGPHGHINETTWREMLLRSNNLMHLRIALASMFGLFPGAMANIVICLRAGPFGQITPLHIDLPLGNYRIIIVLVALGTPAGDNLLYPDLNAP